MASHEGELLSQIAQGNQQAMMEFYDQYFGIVAGYCRKMIADRNIADEVIQDTFMQVWRTAAVYDAGRAPVTGWLLTLARSRAIDRLRKVAREPTQAGLDEAVGLEGGPSDQVETAVVKREAETTLHQAMETLPAAQKNMIEAVYIRGQTAEEAARRQNIPVGTAKTRLRLGLEKLRRALEVYTSGP
ncbi:MAG: RNA polymerase sigma factor [Sulfobacillus thermosulfidooxidans]|uniref:RNA polymerase sigma factor n=1 Tax=Sulfobacillus TaxID=28033 RepID=UPI000CD0A691|nr:RNA polymerase sigma factor [Sulfobacillus sp. hq2]POB09625.1 RNA polymerase subunit sigma-24 [Sulfobacillus sp. hq2]PSR37857.1 MAG: RNA polymerase sigma factor [Sulfobacillus thermosulfidooxidans]